MHLINVRTFQLETFLDERTLPPYAILSHTWLDREVQYGDFIAHGKQTLAQPDSDDKTGSLDWQKIRLTCKQAVEDSHNYAWIDTCCIDKTSSSELSEAINSMFRWYQNSAVCYVYMTDVHVTSEGIMYGFENSRWFTRGWTLQELIAPSRLIFFDCGWRQIGGWGLESEALSIASLPLCTCQPDAPVRSTWSTSTGPSSIAPLEPGAFMTAGQDGDPRELLHTISSITGISQLVLRGGCHLLNVGVATRMSWASRRTTSRVEDEAYCLLGLFGVNMPMLYGEGTKAFERLQQMIISQTGDDTIFAWNGTKAQLLAPSASDFSHSGSIIPRRRTLLGQSPQARQWTNLGLHVALPHGRTASGQQVIILNCVDSNFPTHFLARKVRFADQDDALLLKEQELIRQKPRSTFELPIDETVPRRLEPVDGHLVYLVPHEKMTLVSSIGGNISEKHLQTWPALLNNQPLIIGASLDHSDMNNRPWWDETSLQLVITHSSAYTFLRYEVFSYLPEHSWNATYTA